MKFAPSALQPRATVGPVSAVAVHSAFRRLQSVLCAIEVGYGVLTSLWPDALLARPFRRPLLPLGEDGRPELVPGRHCPQPYPAFRAPFAGSFRSAALPGAARVGFSASTDRRSASMRLTTFVGGAVSGCCSGGKPACLR